MEGCIPLDIPLVGLSMLGHVFSTVGGVELELLREESQQGQIVLGREYKLVYGRLCFEGLLVDEGGM